MGADQCLTRRPFIASRDFWMGGWSTLLVLALIVGAVSTIAEWWG